MIISRTPLRVSFFGGGTDYPMWYKNNGGAVLSTSIDKHSFIQLRYLPPFFDHKHQLTYKKREEINDIDEIKHPSIRECFRFTNVKEGLSLSYSADLPSMTGLGSSSAFTVGLLNAIYALKGLMFDKHKLTRDAIHVEQDLIKENVGSQDQTATAFGGFNKIEFSGNHNIVVKPVAISSKRLGELQNHLMLFFTGFARYASEVAAEQIKNISKKEEELIRMRKMVEEAEDILLNGELDDFGRLLDEGWKLKRNLSSKISNSFINQIYETGRKAGALGGKILGAGGGGFMLFFVRPEDHIKIKNALSNLLHVPFKFEKQGSQVIYKESDNL